MPIIDRYRYVLWDFNGTLIDDLDAGVRIQQVMLKQYGLPPLTRERYLATFDFPIRDWYAYLGYDVGRYEQLAAQWTALYDAAAPSLGLCPGARALLDLFKDRGLGQSVLSAAHQKQLDALLAHLGILPYFEYVFGLDNSLAGGKLGLCRAFERRVSVPPGQVLLIGDTTQDALSARTLGCDCALVLCGHQNRARLEATGEKVFETLDSLRAYLSA